MPRWCEAPKVVRGDDVGSPHYPPAGIYVFRYSLSSAAGEWKSSKAYRAGMDFTNPLLPVSVVDTMSQKSLPPSQSFCSVGQENVVVSTLKKADADASLVLRVYEMEGRQVSTAVTFLGAGQTFTSMNLLEEDSAGREKDRLDLRPFEIGTIRMRRPYKP